MKFVEGHEVLRRDRAPTRSSEAMDAFRKTRGGRDQAVHLPVGRRQQRRVHRDARARRRGRHAVLRRALRPRDVEGRHPVYGKQGADAFRTVARDRRREEHRQRQRAPEGRAPLVRVLRREDRRRTRLCRGGSQNRPLHARQAVLELEWAALEPPLLLVEDLNPRHLAEAGVAGVGDADRVRAELGRSGQRDRARDARGASRRRRRSR